MGGRRIRWEAVPSVGGLAPQVPVPGHDPMVTAESAGQVAAALDFYSQGFDFADALHLAASEGTAALYTFDERFIRKGRDAVPPVWGVPEG